MQQDITENNLPPIPIEMVQDNLTPEIIELKNQLDAKHATMTAHLDSIASANKNYNDVVKQHRDIIYKMNAERIELHKKTSDDVMQHRANLQTAMTDRKEIVAKLVKLGVKFVAK